MMPQTQTLLREKSWRRCLPRHTRLLLAATGGVGCLVHAGIASAAEATAGQVPMGTIPLAQIFTLLFLMLGPFKIIGAFARITKGADAAFARLIALRAALFASLALLVAAFLGERVLSSYGIPLPVLSLSGGTILFLVALQNILKEFAPHDEGTAGPALTPTLNMALTPLAFPTIVTPYGIAAVVVFLAVSPDQQSRLAVGAILLAIMLLNLIVMVMTRRLRPVMGLALQILGAVLGVIQVALGLQIILRSLRTLGVL
jgi:multiple antibiotic resistance protein